LDRSSARPFPADRTDTCWQLTARALDPCAHAEVAVSRAGDGQLQFFSAGDRDIELLRFTGVLQRLGCPSFLPSPTIVNVTGEPDRSDPLLYASCYSYASLQRLVLFSKLIEISAGSSLLSGYIARPCGDSALLI